MQEKKRKIIESSIELFANKGFYSTSVQEIVERAKVAKGSFYNYFDSKEDLILSIYDYYYVVILEKMNQAKADANDPREALLNQLHIYFNFIIENKPLIIMLLRDQVPLGNQGEFFIIKMRQRNFEWCKKNILAIYGEDIRQNQHDAAAIFDGLLHTYSSWIVVAESSLNIKELPQFLLRRLDDLCRGLIKDSNAPAIRQLPKFFQSSELIFDEMKSVIKGLMLDDQEKAIEAVNVIEVEFEKEHPQWIIVESMLEFLKKYESIQEHVKTLEQQIKSRGEKL